MKIDRYGLLQLQFFENVNSYRAENYKMYKLVKSIDSSLPPDHFEIMKIKITCLFQTFT